MSSTRRGRLGTARSGCSRCKKMWRSPDSVAPRTLFVLGGAENPAVRSLLVDLVRPGTDSPWRGIESSYRPTIAAADASEILKTCSFAWFNYFHRPGVETSMILK